MKRILTLLLLIVFQFAIAQDAQVHWDMINSGNYTFEEIKRVANEYFKGKDTGKGSGYKQYKRWEYFASRMVDANGYVETEEKIQEEMAAFNRKQKRRKVRPSNGNNISGNWEELGVFAKNPTSSWNPGVGRVECISVDPNDPNHILLGLPSGGAWSTKVGGNDWKNLTDNKTVLDIRGVAISPLNSQLYFMGTTSGLYRSTDQGANWSKVISSGRVTRIIPHPTNSSIILTAGSGGIKRSTDGGLSFTTMKTGNYRDLVYKPGDPNFVYACDGSGFFRSTDNGRNWSSVSTTGSGTGRIAVTPANPNVVYYTKAKGSNFDNLFKSTNSGQSFTTVGNHSVDYYEGYSWYGIDIAVSDTDENLVYMGGMELYRSTDGGNTFSLHARWSYGNNKIKYIHADIHCLEWVNGHLYTGTDGAISIDDQNGAVFHDLSTTLGARQFYKIGVSRTEANTVTAGAQDNGTAVMVGEDRTWYEWLGADGMETFVDWSNPNHLYGTSQNGTLYRSTNKGQSYSGFSGPGGKGNWVTPFEQDPIDANTFYVGIGGLQKKVGSGSWQLISNFTDNLDEVKIAQTNNQIIYAADGSTLYRTLNGGNSWNTVSGLSGTINYITIHPEDPNYVAVATSGGSKIYVSTNGGSSFTGIQKNLPNLAAQCAVWQDGSDHGLYVGLTDGIYYIDDNETQWLPFMDNMPNVRISEMEINYAAKVIYAGTYGRGLWVSDCYGKALLQNDVQLVDFAVDLEDEICSSSASLRPEITIKNLGVQQLTNLQVNILIDGNQVSTYTFSGNLASKNDQNILLPTIANIGPGNHTLTLSAVNPNGQTDEDPSNNDLSHSFNVVDGKYFQLTFLADDYSYENSWELKEGNTVLYAADYSQNDIGANNSATYDFCLADGCYDFVVNDDYGDGLSGGTDGDYEIISVDDGATVVEMDVVNFGKTKTHDFCISNVVLDRDVAVLDVLDVPADLCGNSIIPKAKIKNLGKNTLTTIDLEVYVGGLKVKTISHTTTLAKGATEEVSLGNVDFSTSGSQSIKVVAVNPNGALDENLANNESQKSIDITVGAYHELYIADRSFNRSLSWEIKEGGTIVETNAGKQPTLKNGDQVFDFCLSEGCFDVVVTDAFSSGGCSSAAWTTNQQYCQGEKVSFKGDEYESKWCGAGNPPDEQNYQWTKLGPCAITYDSDKYGLRKLGETAYFEVEVQNYNSPQSSAFCHGNTITVDFTADKVTANNCDNITFTSTTAPVGTSYNWNFGPGASPQTANGIGPHQVSYATLGKKSVELTVDGITELKTDFVTITENSALNPTVSIQEASSTNCEGEKLDFESTVSNEGNAPVYEWMVNGQSIGSNQNFSSSNLKDGDKVKLKLTSSEVCAVSNEVFSNELTVSLTSKISPSISISATKTDICDGDSVGFSAMITGGGNSPQIDWYIGANKVASGLNFDSNNLNDQDVVSAILTSDLSCVTNNSATSSDLVINVNLLVASTVSIQETSSNNCLGDQLSFESNTSNVGNKPNYEWMVNGQSVSNNEDFTSSTLADGDKVILRLTSSANCVASPSVTSNEYTVNLATKVTPTIAISASKFEVCDGETISFVSSNNHGGNSPIVEWYVNNQKVQTGDSYLASFLNDQDVVSAKLVSDLSCVTSTEVMSTERVVTVKDYVTPNVSITSDASVVCSGTSIEFESNVTNEGSTPIITWYLDDVEVSSGANFTLSNPTDASVVRATLLSNLACVSDVIVLSNEISLTVDICTGIDDLSGAVSLDVYPNPVTEILHLEGLEMERVEVINTAGQIIYTTSLSGSINEIDMSSLASGSYTIKVLHEKGEESFNIVKP